MGIQEKCVPVLHCRTRRTQRCADPCPPALLQAKQTVSLRRGALHGWQDVVPVVPSRCRIAEIELEMSRTQKNKATEYHLGQLKARLAKLRTELQEGNKKVQHRSNLTSTPRTEGRGLDRGGVCRQGALGRDSRCRSTAMAAWRS